LGTDNEIASQIGEVKKAQHALRENLIMVKNVTMPDNCTLRIESDDGTITNLDLSQCAGKVPAIRRDPITGDLQWWNGTSWEGMPGPPATEPTPDPNDPRFQGGDWETPASGTGVDVVCRAADSMMQALQLAANEVVDGIDWSNETWLSTFSIASAGLSSIAGLFSVFATGNPALGLGIGLSLYGYLDAVASEFLGLASSYSLSEAEDLASSLNSNWTDLRCLIYCNLDSDGQMSYEGWLNLMDEIDFEIDTLADPSWYEFIRPIVEMAGTDSLNAAYAEYQSTMDDCSACTCRMEGVVNFDGAAGDLPYEAHNDGTVQSGVGIDGTDAIREVKYQSYTAVAPAVDIGSEVEIVSVEYWTYLNGPEGGRRNLAIQSSLDDDTYTGRWGLNGTNPGPGWKKYSVTFSPRFNARYVRFVCGEGGSLGNYDARIDAIKIVWRA
jgi:hypothetical protein